jgi:hypothetical protein
MFQLGNRYSDIHELFGVKRDKTKWIVTEYQIF